MKMEVKSLTKQEAAEAYVKLIMERGDPEEYVWNHVSGMALWELEQALEEIDPEQRYLIEVGN
jgi:hypothetical protein